MRIYVLVVFIALLSVQPASSSNSDWLTPEDGVRFDTSPSNYNEIISNEDKVVWFGKVENVSAYINNKNETIIEYNCKHLVLNETNIYGLYSPYEVKNQNSGYFIFSIRAPKMTQEDAIELSKKIASTAKIAIVKGSPYKIIEGNNINIVYITSDQIITADDSIITLIE